MTVNTIIKPLTNAKEFETIQLAVFGMDTWPPVIGAKLFKSNYLTLGIYDRNVLVSAIAAKVCRQSARLLLVCTLPSHRNRSLAQLLLAELVQILERRRIATLLVEDYLESAVGWYEKMGFVPADLTLVLHLKPVDTAFLTQL